MSSENNLAVIILSWNGREDTLACLKSLESGGHPKQGETFVVVDNGSVDGTLEEVAARFPWVTTIQNGANIGFAAGNNAGLRWALERGFHYVMLLNNDTEVPPGAIEALLAFMDDNLSDGGVQPLLVRQKDEKRIDSMGIRVGRRPGAVDLAAGEMAGDIGDGIEEIFGPCGAAALFRSAAIRDAGLLDEQFFAILEDVELAFRIRLKGWSFHVVKSTRVFHRRGISGVGSEHPLKRALIFANLQVIMWRYWPTSAIVRYSPLWLRWQILGGRLWKKMGRQEEYRRRLKQARSERVGFEKNPAWSAIQRRWLR